MSQRLQVSGSRFSWRGGDGERLWLAALVDAMEEAARQPEACDGRTLAALRTQLALPARLHFGPPVSLN